MMEKFLVEGANSLKGSIEPSGNKNEALPVLAAVLLANDIVRLTNVPDILDIRSMCGILEELGVGVERTSSAVMFLTRPHFSIIPLIRKKQHRSVAPFCWLAPCWLRRAGLNFPIPVETV